MNEPYRNESRASDTFVGGKWGVIGSIVLAMITVLALYCAFYPSHSRPIPQAVEDR